MTHLPIKQNYNKSNVTFSSNNFRHYCYILHQILSFWKLCSLQILNPSSLFIKQFLFQALILKLINNKHKACVTPHFIFKWFHYPLQKDSKWCLGKGDPLWTISLWRKIKQNLSFPSFTFNDASLLSSHASQGCACLSAFETGCIVSGKVRTEVMGNCNSCFTFQSGV